jgi:DNA-binding NarL/FixJ family response regulator
MTTRVLIINRQLVFAVTIKQALEQTGAFEVHPFTSAEPAFEYLRTHPHDVALVDFTLPNGAQIVQGLRALQPEIAVIVSPAQPDAAVLIRDFKLQGIIDAPFSARSIIPLIEHAVAQVEQPSSAITRNLPGSDQDADGATELLPGSGMPNLTPEPPQPPKRKKSAEAEPPKPRVLETRDFEQTSKPPAPGVTRILDNKPAAPPSTRILDENQLPADSPQTRVLDPKSPPRKIKPLAQTPAPPPADLPEFSSLDDVLQSEAQSQLFDLEPPIGDDDTPPVPVVDSDAVRQFLATKPRAGDDTFGNLLGTIDPNKSASTPSSSFDDLVNSMRSQPQHTALPDRHQQFIDFILTGGMDNLLTEIEKSKTEPLDDTDTFRKLSEEEPPMPTLEESGTVGDLMLGVSDTGFRSVLAMMSGEEAPVQEANEERQRLSKEMEEAFAAFFEQQVEAEPPFLDEPAAKPIKPIKRLKSQPPPSDERATPAQLILETAHDESAPVETFSLDSLIVNIERQLSEHTPDVQALPSWGEDLKQQQRKVDDRYIKEPDFLPEEFSTSQMVPITADEPFHFEPDVETPVERPAPPVTLPDWDDIAQWDAPESDADFDELDDWADVTILGKPVLPEAESPAQPPVVERSSPPPAPTRPPLDHDFFLRVDESTDEPTVVMPTTLDEPLIEAIAPPIVLTPQIDTQEEPYIAQIALSLTQVSLELTADATLLTRSEELVAYAGTLSQDDIEEFRLAIGGNWETEGNEPRIRFVRLGSSGGDYMLYSRRTDGDFTLSMIFNTQTPLRDIRRQGKRLMEALESVPESEPTPPSPPLTLPEAAPAASVTASMANAESLPVTLAPYAYVWLSNTALEAADAQAIELGLPVHLREQGWQVRKVEAQGEYVYILADVPGEQPAHEVVRDLKRRAAALVHMRTPEATLAWTDGYLVMTPGRPLESEEIEQFIRFERLQ